MLVNLYTFVGLYDRALATAAHLLDKGSAFAAANGFSEADMLAWRLIGDMKPLAFQVMVMINFAQQWPARVAGLPVPEAISDGLNLTDLKAAIAEARVYLATLTADQFAGRDAVPLTHKLGEGMELTLPSGQWLSVFTTTNLNFHLSTAYGILRSQGVPLGKPDLFAGGL
jgi:hypothetical protein